MVRNAIHGHLVVEVSRPPIILCFERIFALPQVSDPCVHGVSDEDRKYIHQY